MRHFDVSASSVDSFYFAQTQPVNEMTTDSQSVTSTSVRVAQDPAEQAVSDPVDPDSLTSAEPAQARVPPGDLSSCEAVLAQKLKSLELQNTLPGQADMGYHKSLALDPSCLLTPPNTPQGMELAELEADLQEGTRQLKKGKSVLQIRKEVSVRISSKYKPKQSSKYLFIYSLNPEHPEHQALTNIHLP